MQLISSAQLKFVVTEGGAEFKASWQTYCSAPAQIKFTALRLKDKLVSFREATLFVVKVRTPAGWEINRFVLSLERCH